MTARPQSTRPDSHRVIAWVSILSLPICFAAMYTFLAAVNFDEALTDLPAVAISVINTDYLAAWGIFDILGYYLMRVPLIIILWHWLRPQNPVLADIATVCALFYVILAVVAASTLTGAVTGIAGQYATQDPITRAGLEGAWIGAVSTAYDGIWQYNLLPWAVWGIAMGGLLKTQHRWLGLSLQAIGLTSLLNVIIVFVPEAIRPVFAIAGSFQVHFSSLWMVWAGVVLLRGVQYE